MKFIVIYIYNLSSQESNQISEFKAIENHFARPSSGQI